MEIFCKKCGNTQEKTPVNLIGEFCICDYCGELFTWYKKNGYPLHRDIENEQSNKK